MARKASDYTRYSIYSERDPNSGSYQIPPYEKDIRNIVNNAVKSALPEGAYFKLGEKHLDQSGRVRYDVYFHKEDAGIVGKSLRTAENEFKFAGSTANRYHITRARPVTDDEAKLLSKEERSQERAQEKAERQAEQKKSEKRARDTISHLMGIYGAILTVVNITRRILTNIMKQAEQATRDNLTASNLGMDYNSVRMYSYMEKTHGMKEGTVTGAVNDIQTKFGNITKLDKKALEDLAVVMGNKIEEMATMGLGASNPEKVLGAILDSFNEKANAGYNSVGQYVGEQQARRELYSYLNRISPQVADIFATMQEEQHNINSLFRNQASTWEGFKNLTPIYAGNNLDGIDWNSLATLGNEMKLVQSHLKSIKESIGANFANKLFKSLKFINNLRIFMSETDNRKLNAENRAKNNAELDRVNNLLSKYENIPTTSLSPQEQSFVATLKQYKESLEKENNEKYIGDATLPYEVLRQDVKDNLPLYLYDRLNNPTAQEIKATYEAYNGKLGLFGGDVDIAKAKREYYDSLPTKAQKKAEKLAKEANKEQDELLEKTQKELKKKYKGFKNLGVSSAQITEAMAIAEVFGIETGITDEDTTAEVKEKLEKAGLVARDNPTLKTDTWHITDLARQYKNQKHTSDEFYESAEVNEDDFWLWWYKNGGLNRIKEHQQQYIIEQEKAKVKDTPAGALWLYEESSPANVGKTYAGQTGNVRGVMDTSSGVTVYKLLIDVQTDKGKKTLEILSQEGVTNTTGNVGRFTITPTGEVQLFPTQGETTSETMNG